MTMIEIYMSTIVMIKWMTPVKAAWDGVVHLREHLEAHHMMKRKLLPAVCVLALLAAVGILLVFLHTRSEQTTEDPPAATAGRTASAGPDWSGMTAERDLPLQYATQFSVTEYEGGYSLINIADSGRYLVVPEGKAAPVGLDDDIVVLYQPLDRIYLAATSAMLVGRNTESLTGMQIVKAAVETVAENTSDGVIAPLFWMILGGPVAGFVYKAINTMVVFLSTGLLEQLSAELVAGGYAADTPAAIVYKATWPEERKYVCTIGTLAQCAKENNVTKTALMIIGDAVLHANYRRSDLYHPNFTTEYRAAKPVTQ